MLKPLTKKYVNWRPEECCPIFEIYMTIKCALKNKADYMNPLSQLLVDGSTSVRKTSIIQLEHISARYIIWRKVCKQTQCDTCHSSMAPSSKSVVSGSKHFKWNFHYLRDWWWGSWNKIKWHVLVFTGSNLGGRLLLYHTWVWNRGICRCVITHVDCEKKNSAYYNNKMLYFFLG